MSIRLSTAAYVILALGALTDFLLVDAAFQQVAKLEPYDPLTNSRYGSFIVLSQDTFIAGAPGDNQQGNLSGSAYVYIGEGSNWTLQTKLTASDARAGDNFGASLAFESNSKDVVLIASTYGQGATSRSGCVYRFSRSGTVWTQGATKLVATGGADNDGFGFHMSLDGNTVLVGAPYRAGGVGGVYAFSKNAGVWTADQTLFPDTAKAGDYIGWSTAISDNTAVLGSFNNDPTTELLEDLRPGGKAYVYGRAAPGQVWALLTLLTPALPRWDFQFGIQVAVSGNNLAVSSMGRIQRTPYNELYGTGAVHVYQRSSSSNQFLPTAQFRQPRPFKIAGTKLGVDGLLMMNSTLMAGAAWGSQTFSYTKDWTKGAVMIYRTGNGGSSWAMQQRIMTSDAAGALVGGDFFGRCHFAYDGTTLVVASLKDDPQDVFNGGSIYVFMNV